MTKAIAVRIVGFAATHRGFGVAVTEGPRRLVTWHLYQTSTSRVEMAEKVGRLLRRYRPLFVAFQEPHRLDGRRSQAFTRAVEAACQAQGIMTLLITRRHVRSVALVARPTKWRVAKALGELFPEVRGQLPPPRRRWRREDDRVGLFMSLAAAVAAWEGFRAGRQ